MIEEAVCEHCPRAHSYKILAECFYPPDGRLVKALGELGTAARECLPEIIGSIPRVDDLGRHMVDYSRLFLGPFKVLAPPYGSVYLEDGKFMGSSSLDAREVYNQEGLNVVLKEAPDHISVELEFMYLLVLKEAEARDNSDCDHAAVLRDKQASFLQTHLGRWIGSFVENIERHAQTDFYRTLGRVTRGLVGRDMEMVLVENGAG